MSRNITTSPVASQLLSLVKTSLWQCPVDYRLFENRMVDWDGIAALAVQQTVAGLAFSGAMSLPETIRPPREWVNKAHVYIERLRRTNLHVNKCVAESVTRLREEGCRPILLKGQAYAGFYPDPMLRQCGDIDLYVGENDYCSACEASRRLGWKYWSEICLEDKHYKCCLHGVLVEIHRVAESLSPLSVDRRFRKWCDRQLSSDVNSSTIGDCEVDVPSPLFDVVFAFLHLYRHFLLGGVGLRQVCDWAILLHTHHASIDSRELEMLLADFGLLRWWCMFAPIVVEHLGLPAAECPFYTSRYSEKSRVILSFILKDGNFGRSLSDVSARPDGYMLGKIYSFHRCSGRLLSILRIEPYNVVQQYVSYLYTGIKKVVSDIFIHSVGVERF